MATLMEFNARRTYDTVVEIVKTLDTASDFEAAKKIPEAVIRVISNKIGEVAKNSGDKAKEVTERLNNAVDLVKSSIRQGAEEPKDMLNKFVERLGKSSEFKIYIKNAWDKFKGKSKLEATFKNTMNILNGIMDKAGIDGAIAKKLSAIIVVGLGVTLLAFLRRKKGKEALEGIMESYYAKGEKMSETLTEQDNPVTAGKVILGLVLIAIASTVAIYLLEVVIKVLEVLTSVAAVIAAIAAFVFGIMKIRALPFFKKPDGGSGEPAPEPGAA